MALSFEDSLRLAEAEEAAAAASTSIMTLSMDEDIAAIPMTADEVDGEIPAYSGGWYKPTEAQIVAGGYKYYTTENQNGEMVEIIDQEYCDDNVSVVDKNKNISLNAAQKNITQEANANYIPFEIPRYYDCFDLAAEPMIISINWKNSANQGLEYVAPVDVYYNEEIIHFAWLLDSNVTQVAGAIQFEIQVEGENSKGETYRWKTSPTSGLNVQQSLGKIEAITPDEEWQENFLAQVTAAKNEAQTAKQEALKAQEAAQNAQKAAQTAQTAAETAAQNAAADASAAFEENINTIVEQSVSEQLDNYYDKTETDNLFASAKESINTTLQDYATITWVSTQFDNSVKVDEKIENIIGDINGETVAEAIENVDISGTIGDLGESSTVVDYVDTAVKAVDVSEQLKEYAKTEEVNQTVSSAIGDISPSTTVAEAIAAIDISDSLGDLGTIVDEETQEERTRTVVEYVDAAIKTVDVSSQLKDYAKASDLEDLETDVNEISTDLSTAVEDVSNLKTAVKTLQENASANYTYDIAYDSTTNQFSLYEYTDEENQEEDPSYAPKTVITVTGGSGGGAGGTKIVISRTTSTPLIVAAGDKAIIQYNVEATDSAGDTLSEVTASWKINGKIVKTETIVPGDNTFDITEYITTSSQTFLLTVTASDGSLATKDWKAYAVDLSIASTFDDTKPYSGDVAFKYVPYGNVSKTIHFVLDGKELPTATTTVSGSTQTYTIPAQSHGSHLLEIYLTATVGGKTLESNHVYKDIMWYDAEVGTTVIGSTYQNFTARQYESTGVEYVVYVDATTETVDATLEASYVDAETGETVVESSTVVTVATGIKQIWTYKSSVIGKHTLTITANGTVKTLTANIVELGIDVEPITAGLVFDFDPTGYSNDSTDRIWSYTNSNNETYTMTLSDNFDWVNGGYQIDANGDQYFLIKSGTTAEINYELFGDDAKATGKQFKLIFMTENVADGEAVFLDSLSEVPITDEESGATTYEQVGIQMKAHEATIYAKVENLPLPYAEEEIIEFEFNISQKDEVPSMVMGYEDGVSTRPMVYDSTHEFQQRAGYKKTIMLGSPDCDLRVYRFKVYNMSLSDEEILNNFIADARNAEEMIDRYDRNQIYDPNNNYLLTPEYLAEMCPDLRIIKIECPRFTTDKKDFVGGTNIEMIYKNGDPILDNWYTTDCVHSGQGTSSNNYGPSGRNLDLILKKYSKDGTDYNSDPHIYYKDGTEVSKVALTRTSVPVNWFNIKVNIASSENANNALLQRRYNQYNPYKRPFVRYGDSLEDHFSEEEIAEMTEEQKETLLKQYQAKADEVIPFIKDTMEFHNCVIFLRETGVYTDGSSAPFTEFDDGQWHFYAMGNIGDSKKTDNTRLTDPRDPYECIVEVMDNTMPLSTFPTGYTNPDGSPKYPISVAEWETMDNSAYSALYYEEFDEVEGKDKENGLDDTYGMRYLWDDGTDEENDEAWTYVKDKWREFYKFVVTASDQEFHDHLGDYVVLDSILYYYLFTLRYTMTDNHAKNCFWHYGKSNDKDVEGNAIRKWDLCFDYDNDTALGIDNYGRMSYRYGYEEIDYVDGTSDWVWNAPQHVFFLRIRELFDDELSALFMALESQGAWSATDLIKQWNDSQAQFPEELWRVDIDRKYIRPFTGSYINGPAYEEFLRERANGRKKTQRAQFEKNQEKYISSKFGGNVASSDDIILRCSVPNTFLAVPANFDITLTPFSYIYLNVKYNTASPVKVRAVPNQEYTIEYPAELADIIEIYSASCLKSIGDLSACYLINGTFSNATKIRELILGSSVAGYNNTNAMTLGLGSNNLLNKLDIQNMSGLTQSLDLSRLFNLKELYAYGTSSVGVTFAEGGAIEYVELPNLASLSMKDLTYLENEGFLTEGFSKLSSLVAENSKLDLVPIIQAATNLYRVRITNVNWTLDENSMSVLERLYNMTGFNNNGDNIDQSVLTGRVYVPTIKQKPYEDYTTAWPELTIDAGVVTPQYPVTFVNYDGAVLDIQYIDKGENPIDPLTREENPIEKPTKPSSVSTVYTFDHWDGSFAAVHSERTIQAAYSESVRQYKIQYYNPYTRTVLQESSGYYGENIPYTGDIPTYSGQEAGFIYHLFNRWDKSGFLLEDEGATEIPNDIKVVTAKFDSFEYTDETVFDGKELKDLSPVEIYALGKLAALPDNIQNGAAGILTSLSVGDTYSFEMGYDVNYDDVKSEVLIDSPVTFTGSNHLDLTDVKLFDEDKDFILAIDFSMATANETNATIAQCFHTGLTNGFKVQYDNGAVFTWGGVAATSKIALNGNREMLVIRHKKGDNNIYIYSSNLDSMTPVTQTVEKTTSSIADTNVVFGCAKAANGRTSNFAIGTVYWSKVWYKDLGEEVCEKLVGWTHESINLAVDGFNRYPLADDATAESMFSLLATHLLDRGRRLFLTSNDNSGGYRDSYLAQILNQRFYAAIPDQIKMLVKKIQVPSSIGNGNTTLESSSYYVLIPGAFDVYSGLNSSEAYLKGEVPSGETIATMVTAADRQRAYANGTYANYWLRSTYSSNYFMYYVDKDGGVQQFGSPSGTMGVLIELSF